jgi:hypothetical protein
MSNFVGLASGLDIAPLQMALARQDSVFEGNPDGVVLFAKGEWDAEYFAFPQLRLLLLDVMRRMECGILWQVQLFKLSGEVKVVPALENATDGLGLISIGEVFAVCGNDHFSMATGSVAFCSGAAQLDLMSQTSGCLLLLSFAPLP